MSSYTKIIPALIRNMPMEQFEISFMDHVCNNNHVHQLANKFNWKYSQNWKGEAVSNKQAARRKENIFIFFN